MHDYEKTTNYSLWQYFSQIYFIFGFRKFIFILVKL